MPQHFARDSEISRIRLSILNSSHLLFHILVERLFQMQPGDISDSKPPDPGTSLGPNPQRYISRMLPTTTEFPNSNANCHFAQSQLVPMSGHSNASRTNLTVLNREFGNANIMFWSTSLNLVSIFRRGYSKIRVQDHDETWRFEVASKRAAQIGMLQENMHINTFFCHSATPSKHGYDCRYEILDKFRDNM
jgi:hypothetical protein